jgi:hypothetical protein
MNRFKKILDITKSQPTLEGAGDLARPHCEEYQEGTFLKQR